MRPYLAFLSALAEHNSKEWMDANKKWFIDTRETLLEDVALMLGQLTELEPELAAFKSKDCVFRQNRDIRFSADKTPYKTNFGIYFATGGKKSPGPGYYVQIQPGNSFLAGGIWMPEADMLKKIRKEIDYSGEELERIVNDPEFKRLFPQIEGERLKTSPRDYDADHRYIEYLKLKSYNVTHPLSDKAVHSGVYIQFVLDGFRRLKPFNDFLSRAIDDAEDGAGIL
jgi:uncharacterized protein (TIGR02453 family)